MLGDLAGDAGRAFHGCRRGSVRRRRCEVISLWSLETRRRRSVRPFFSSSSAGRVARGRFAEGSRWASCAASRRCLASACSAVSCGDLRGVPAPTPRRSEFVRRWRKLVHAVPWSRSICPRTSASAGQWRTSFFCFACFFRGLLRDAGLVELRGAGRDGLPLSLGVADRRLVRCSARAAPRPDRPRPAQAVPARRPTSSCSRWYSASA